MEITELEKFKSKLSSIFLAALQKRTGWGKNDVYREFETAVKDTEIEMMKEKLEKVDKPRTQERGMDYV